MSDETVGRLRFIPKKLGEGRAATWRVYDLQSGGFPYQTPELGVVVQDLTEDEIKAECDRLTAEHGYLNAKARAAASRSKVSAIAAAADDAAQADDSEDDEA